MAKRAPQRVKNNVNKQAVYQEVVQKSSKKNKTPDQLKLLLNPEDTPQNPLTYHRLMDWLADTGWVEGYIRKRISPMDAHLIEDYTQSIWLAILTVKQDYIMNSWYSGKGRFVCLMKKIIDIQLHCTSTDTYKTNKHWHHMHTTLTDESWRLFEDGDTHTTWTDRFPVKYNCPSGNRKKMVKVEYEDLPDTTEKEFLVDSINLSYIDGKD